MNRCPLTAVVLARNEAKNLPRCLASLLWCDEVVVVDDHSTDATADIAREWGARVLQHPFESFAGQRNWALELGELTHQWVLMLDADEASSPAFETAVRQAIAAAGTDVVAFKTCRKTWLLGRWIQRADEFPVWIMRLVRRGSARFESQGHGEVPVPALDGAIGRIDEPFLHYAFSHGLSDWLVKHVRYAEREARLELAAEAPVRLAKLFAADAPTRRRELRTLSRRIPARPLLRFLYHYLARGGFLEGRSGLAFSLLKSIYEAFIVLKRWELSAEIKDGQAGDLNQTGAEERPAQFPPAGRPDQVSRSE